MILRALLGSNRDHMTNSEDRAALEDTFSDLSRRLHQHLALARDAETSNRALSALLHNAQNTAGATGFAGVTHQLIETNRNLQEYTDAVGNAIASAVAIFQDLESTVQQFEQEFGLLRDRLDAIRQSTRQVADIALQSRMVAINASIQASHIGEAGAGFAVVAREVRDLSTRTTKISETVAEDLAAVERPLEETTRRFEENHGTLIRAKNAVESLASTAGAMLSEAHALSGVTVQVEDIAFKQVEIQDRLDAIDQHSQWVAQSAVALVSGLANTSDVVDTLWEQSLPPARKDEVASLQAFEQEILEALRLDEPHRARHAAEGAVRARLPVLELLDRVARSAMLLQLDQPGHSLPTETIFRNARIIEDVIDLISEKEPRHARPSFAAEMGKNPPVVVLGNAYEDYHDLGRKLVAMRMRAAGFTVVDLGLSVPNEKFVNAAREHNADVIGVSALLLHTAVAIPKLKKDLQRAGLGTVKVIAGGAPFLVDPLLRAEFGADGVAGNPSEAVRLVSALVQERRQRESV